LSATRSHWPRTLLERNFWLFSTTLPSCYFIAFGTKDRKCLSKRLRYQRNVMAIAHVGERESISERTRQTRNRLKSSSWSNLDTHIFNWF
jgi:hypothetical protein